MESGAGRSSIIDGDEGGVRRTTVEQFQDDDPPKLKFNQMCEEHPDELVVGYNKLTFNYLCGRCVST